MKNLPLLFLTLMFFSCGNSDPTPPTFTQTLEEILPCKIARQSTNRIALGIPKVEGLSPSVGTVNMAVLFVDFDDVPATISTDSAFSIINPIAPDFFQETSYGRMELNLQPHLKWLRLSNSSQDYGTAIYYGEPHLNFLQEAVNLADDEFDFSETDIVLLLCNPAAKALVVGPTFSSLDPDYHIRADGASIPTGITSGYDLNHWGGIWLCHESGRKHPGRATGRLLAQVLARQLR